MTAIDITTLCAEILDGWHFRQNSYGDVQSYHRQLLEVMCSELCIQWHDDSKLLRAAWESPTKSPEPVSTPDMSEARMPYILVGFLDRYGTIRTPFSGVLEYSFAQGEQEVVDAHLSGMVETTSALRQLWQAWLRDMLLLRWPKAASLTTTWVRLAQLGLPKRPDDFDENF